MDRDGKRGLHLSQVAPVEDENGSAWPALGGLRRAWPEERGLTLVEVLVALAILAVAVIPLMDAFSQSLATGERAGQESLRIYLAQSKMEQYLQWFREYRGQGDELEERLETDGVDLDPADSFNPEPQPFDGFPGYAYRASLHPRYGGGEARVLRQLRVEVTGPEGRQVALTTLVW